MWKNWVVDIFSGIKKKQHIWKRIAFFCVLWAAIGQAAFWIQEAFVVSTGVEAYPLQQTPPYTVALDAGHGGFDTGAGCGNLHEVDICEKTVDKLFTLLENNPSFCPVKTRENGEGCSISDRAKKAGEEKASLLLSIHMNYDPSTSQSHGFECFPLPPGRTWSDKSMEIAHWIAEGMGNEGHRLRGNNGIRFAYYSGKRKIIVDAEDNKERTLKSFGILEQVACPAVLVEQCFISNANDRKNWTTEEGCQKAANVYYTAICQYFRVDPQAKPEPSSLPIQENW